MITHGAAAAGRFRNAIEAARDAWTKANLLAISKVGRLMDARAAVQSRDPAAISKLLVDMAGPIKQVRLIDVIGPRMEKHQKLMELVCRVALRCELLQATAAGEPVQLARVQNRLAAWVEAGRWAGGPGPQGELAQVAADMAAVCGQGLKEKDAATVRLALVAPLAPALEHLRLALEVPQAVLEGMAATQAQAKAQAEAQEAADAAEEAADDKSAAADKARPADKD
jgi:hypothetical protein